MSRSAILPVVAALLLATACQKNSGPATPAATPVAEPAPPAPAAPVATPEVRMRGQLVIGKDGYGITLCGETTQRIVGLGAQANALVGEMAAKGAREFFVDGFGNAPADTGGDIARIERASTEGPGCDATEPPFLFKAVGTEPFWSVTLAEGQLRLARPETPEQSGPFAGSPMMGEHRTFTTTTSGGPVTLRFDHATCSDGMSDALYGWTATLRADEKDWKGCAYAGE